MIYILETDIEFENKKYDDVYIIDDYSNVFNYDIIGKEDRDRNDFRKNKHHDTSYVVYENSTSRYNKENNIRYYFEMYNNEDMFDDEYIVMGDNEVYIRR